jgi:hypothetical protein
MKRLAIALVLFTAGTKLHAQNTPAVASQAARLEMSNVLEIGFTNSGTSNGNKVTLSFTSTDDFANGVESAVQELKVRTNKNFNVSVRSTTANFYTLYWGFWPVQSSMAVSNVLDVKVTGNQTGGTIAPAFSGYGNVTTTAQNIITNGLAGGDQTFEVKYKATPGFAYSAGTYFTDVVYTATQQ